MRFVVLPKPTDEEIVDLTTRVVRRLIHVARKHKKERGEEDPSAEPEEQLLRACVAEAAPARNRSNGIRAPARVRGGSTA